MREIRFRAWNKDKKEMVFSSSDKAISFLGELIECVGSNDSGDQWDLMFSKYYEIMQFTGLLDKNGKEIFEGDIVRHENGVVLGVVEFHAPSFVMTVDNMDSFSTFNPYPTFQLEVIGDIYSNPELLNGGHDQEGYPQA